MMMMLITMKINNNYYVAEKNEIMPRMDACICVIKDLLTHRRALYKWLRNGNE